MANILFIDDDPLFLKLMERLLTKSGHDVATAASGEEGLESLEQSKPDLVITDCNMPGKSGLEVISEIKGGGTGTPVILMTAYGDESVVLEAFRRGAINYVNKTAPREEILALVESAVSSIEDDQARNSVLTWQTESTMEFDLDSTINHVQGLVSVFLRWLDACDDVGQSSRLQMGMALTEALNNAVIHGNLGVSSQLKEVDNGRPFHALIEEREVLPEYRDKRVRVIFKKNPRLMTIRVTDQGEGFDTANLPDPEDPEQFFLASGRGILMMRSIFDDVVYNGKGNEVIMFRRIKPQVDEAAETLVA